MKFRLNKTYPNQFLTTHTGLVIKKDEVVEWNKPIDKEIKLYIDQKYLIPVEDGNTKETAQPATKEDEEFALKEEEKLKKTQDTKEDIAKKTGKGLTSDKIMK